VGRYQIKGIVGEGGSGRVYRAWDPQFERWVAIKELLGEYKAREPTKYAEYLARFELERRVQGRFQHPHIVSVYDLVQQGEDDYLIEEFVAGGTLQALIEREGRLSPERVVQIGVEMCQAIAVAWEQDIVHRDVKPGNVLLTRDGHAKLADFGVAQVGQMSQRTQTDNRHPGTPAYMSPEQEQGYGYLDERSDLYSLGLVLYEALSGKLFKRERVPVRQLVPGVPRELAQVVMRALAQDPDERYQRAAEFEMALRHALDRSRPGWLWWVGGAITLLALIFGRFLIPAQEQPSPTPVATSTPSPSLPLTPTATPTKTPTPPSVSAPTSTPWATPVPTVSASPPSVPDVEASAPRLLSPAGATIVRTARVTLRWAGELPNSDYGFQVGLRHGADDYASPVLDGTEWTLDLPGDANEAIGEWRWSVAIVHRETGNVAARSSEWTFYYNPFGGEPPTSHSPLPTLSPLATPDP
jgi:serine/threonine protein kinase